MCSSIINLPVFAKTLVMSENLPIVVRFGLSKIFYVYVQCSIQLLALLTLLCEFTLSSFQLCCVVFLNFYTNTGMCNLPFIIYLMQQTINKDFAKLHSFRLNTRKYFLVV